MADNKLYDHTAEAIFFAGVMWWLIKWIGRTVKDVAEPGSPPEDLTAAITKLESEMAPHAHQTVSVAAPHAYAMHTHTPPVVAHCPACGFQLNAAPQQLPFIADCPSCKRHCSVRGDGPGRISVVVSDQRA